FIRDRFTWLAYFMLAYYAYLQAALGPLMPFLRAELNLNYTVAGLHLSAFALGMIIAGLTAERLAHNWGRRRVFWGGGIGMAVGALLLVLNKLAILTISSAFLMGFLGSLLLVMIQTTLADRHGEQRAIALTESNVGASLSASLAPIFIGAFERFGLDWRAALVLAVIVLAVLAFRFGRESIPANPSAVLRVGDKTQGLPGLFWAYWSVICLCVSVEWCLIFWGADFLEKVVGLGQINAATMMSIFFGAMLLGRIAGSRLTRLMPGTTLLLIAIGITLGGFPIFWLARFAPLNLAGLFIAGLGVANLFPLTLSVALSIASHQSDLASARISFALGLAILIAPLGLGWTADRLNIQNAYGIVGLLLLTATTVIFLANRLAASRALILSQVEVHQEGSTCLN
ncbi:MAG: MFS transporter, partial [Chloroflexota bacterium]